MCVCVCAVCDVLGVLCVVGVWVCNVCMCVHICVTIPALSIPSVFHEAYI